MEIKPDFVSVFVRLQLLSAGERCFLSVVATFLSLIAELIFRFKLTVKRFTTICFYKCINSKVLTEDKKKFIQTLAVIVILS